MPRPSHLHTIIEWKQATIDPVGKSFLTTSTLGPGLGQVVFFFRKNAQMNSTEHDKHVHMSHKPSFSGIHFLWIFKQSGQVRSILCDSLYMIHAFRSRMVNLDQIWSKSSPIVWDGVSAHGDVVKMCLHPEKKVFQVIIGLPVYELGVPSASTLACNDAVQAQR